MSEYVFEIDEGRADIYGYMPCERRERVVRCRDCGHAVLGFADGDDGRAVIGCDRLDRPTKRMIFNTEPDGFCAWGERMNDGEDM